mmetsp:Transcript_105866/g.215862  ORF Transcript_105866/g.215862 Transcript_105866/m.215862 type:complete len:292 (+) Transcript_105866:141-1016(+)|eukprot:CAMPEP_0201202646 /NCGR_PEP_ID=MMETSP0851-20130426/165423_1 /ASSEMBLY_ACC=CAM_ASM_000631 /TAXON_ID=183588 /ORGANISM="Pseudo-nitzschia fraudulenta, Strain WWA7" /LENGTH=291 /DNA_ID=CAMNT_0047490513 /DNA_START=140 /DNA_END=1015 /DNA_ORIENTATION=-
MAGLPFLISAATVAYAVLFPTDEGRIEPPTTLAPSSVIAWNIGPVFNNSFYGGIWVGISFSWFASYEIKRRRLWQRLRLKFLSWLYSSDVRLINDKQQDHATTLIQKLRKPHRISELKGTPIHRKSESDNNDDCICGTHLELVSPDWVLSSNLYCDIVTLPPGTELLSRNADGVEFFYVIKGAGTYVDKDGEKHHISADYGFIVDPECPRGFLVGGRKNDLVLLRATDTTVSGGHNYSVRLQASSLTSSVAILRAGAKKIYQMIEKFSSPAIHTIVPPPPSSKRFVTTPCE